ncbi:MAG: type II CAAX endopeptidase family protein [Pirellulales bacterium]
MVDAAVPEIGEVLPQLAVLVFAVVAFVWALAGVRRRLADGQELVPLRPHQPVIWEGGDVALTVVAYLLVATLLAKIVPAQAPLAERLLANVGLSLGVAGGTIAWLLFRGATWNELGFVGGRWRDDIRTALGGVALVVFPLLMLAAALNALVQYRHPIVDFLDGQRDWPAVAIVIVSAVVVAPLAEEFFFRRVLQGWLEKNLGGDELAPVLLSSLAFAAAHTGQGLAYVPLFPFSLVLGFIALRTGSIVPCILLHALFNAVSVVLLLAQPVVVPAG